MDHIIELIVENCLTLVGAYVRWNIGLRKGTLDSYLKTNDDIKNWIIGIVFWVILFFIIAYFAFSDK